MQFFFLDFVLECSLLVLRNISAICILNLSTEISLDSFINSISFYWFLYDFLYMSFSFPPNKIFTFFFSWDVF